MPGSGACSVLMSTELTFKAPVTLPPAHKRADLLAGLLIRGLLYVRVLMNRVIDLDKDTS